MHRSVNIPVDIWFLQKLGTVGGFLAPNLATVEKNLATGETKFGPII